jgi:transcriptional regulator with XRE-family HTH domain
MRMVRGSPNPRYLHLAARLRKARKESGLTRMALAEKATVGTPTVLYIETDQRIPTVGTVARLASALGVSAAWLAYGLGEQPSGGTASSCDGMAERLRTARTDRGHNRTDLARLAERTPGTISGIENGGQAGVDTIERLAKALNVSPAWLAFGAGDRELARRRRPAVRSAAHP